MKAISTAEYAAEQSQNGARVLPGTSGTLWVQQESGAMTRLPTFHLAPPTSGELRQLFWKGKVAVAGYLLEPDQQRNANAWLYICADRGYSLDKLAPAMRRNVRRGLKELRIEPVSAKELLVHGVQAFCDTRRRVGLSDGTPEHFRRRFTARAKCSGHVFLGAWKDDELAAFLSITEVDDWAEIEGCFSADALLNFRPNDTLMYRALSHYLVEKGGRVVCYGLSSIQADSNAVGLHAFKTKVGFEAKPVHRSFMLHPLLRPFGNRLTLLGLKAGLHWRPRERRLKKAEGMLASILGENRIPWTGAPEKDSAADLLYGQDRYWSSYIKRDPCFLSSSGSPFDEDQDRYAHEFCVGLSGALALEIGCGDGADAIGIIQKYACKKVIAIEVSTARLQIARQNVHRAALSDRIDVLRMDAHQLAFPDHHFDVVFCNSVLLFLDRERFFPEVVRVLKPGGRLLLFRESLTGNPILAVYRALWPAPWKRWAERFARRLTVREIEEAGRRYFASVEHREFHVLFSILRRFWPWLIHRVIRNTVEYKVRGGKWSRALDQMLLRRFPGLRRFAWVTIVCFAAPAGNAKTIDAQRGVKAMNTEMQIIPVQEKDLRAMTNLHLATLDPAHNLSIDLGYLFIYATYSFFLNDKKSFAFGAFVNQRLVGFNVGRLDYYMEDLDRYPLRVLAGFYSVIRHPSVLCQKRIRNRIFKFGNGFVKMATGPRRRENLISNAPSHADGKTATLAGLCVDPKCEALHVASRLLRASAEHCRQNGMRFVRAAMSAGNLASCFGHRKCGFVVDKVISNQAVKYYYLDLDRRSGGDLMGSRPDHRFTTTD